MSGRLHLHLGQSPAPSKHMVNHEGLSKLKDLKELLDIGALTEEEFAEQKKLILNELSGGTSNVSSSKREAVQCPHVKSGPNHHKAAAMSSSSNPSNADIARRGFAQGME